MKYIIILTDGAADYPCEKLGGKTPLDVAEKPYMDYFANHGELFLVKTVPDGLKPGSDVANLSVFGYDPKIYYTGRSPLEAASIGVNLGDNDVSFRANLVTLSDEGNYEDKTMVDYSSDEISTGEADILIKDLSKFLNLKNYSLYTGVSYRHLLVKENAAEFTYELIPPHDISDKKIKEYLPNDVEILDIMKRSHEFLKNHPVNIKRRKAGLHEANSLWVWGDGKKPGIPKFFDKYRIKGAVISAVDLIKGIGKLSGMEVIEVEGATGNINTNFEGKAKAAIDALDSGFDLVYLHIEAPDECGHRGEVENKIKSIQLIDLLVIKYIKEKLDKSNEDYKIMVLPDHPTPLNLKTHTGDPVPCVIYKKWDYGNFGYKFSEEDAKKANAILNQGHLLMDKFLG